MPKYLLVLAFLGLPALAGEVAPGAPGPVTVCEVLSHPGVFAGKPVLLVGRYSFRDYGRFLSEKDCVLRVVLDAKSGPLPPDAFSVDSGETARKLAIVRKSTTLGTFRFGSSDYDRWALVYGRVETGLSAPKHASAREFDEDSRPVMCHSETLVIFLHDQ